MLGTLALERGRLVAPLVIAAIAWYTSFGRTFGIILPPAAVAYNAACCLGLGWMWWMLLHRRAPARWGHVILAVLWFSCASATMIAKISSDSEALDFLVLLEIVCVAFLLHTPQVIALLVVLDALLLASIYRERAIELPEYLGLVVACHVLGFTFHRKLRAAELGVELGRRKQQRLARAKARQLAELAHTRREQDELETQVAVTRRLEATGTLAASVAHELNNLFTSITISAQMLAKTHGRCAEYGPLVEETARGSKLTRNLLHFSRSASSEHTPHQIEQITANAVSLMSRMLPKSIEVAARTTTSASVACDPVQLSQVFLNVALNAARAQNEQGTIVLETRELVAAESRRRVAEIAIHDSGCGMDEETRQRAFEPFFTTKPLGDGVGLGLSTAWNIVRAHGGTMKIESQIGVGTVVRIHLPIEEGGHVAGA